MPLRSMMAHVSHAVDPSLGASFGSTESTESEEVDFPLLSRSRAPGRFFSSRTDFRNRWNWRQSAPFEPETEHRWPLSLWLLASICLDDRPEVFLPAGRRVFDRFRFPRHPTRKIWGSQNPESNWIKGTLLLSVPRRSVNEAPVSGRPRFHGPTDHGRSCEAEPLGAERGGG